MLGHSGKRVHKKRKRNQNQVSTSYNLNKAMTEVGPVNRVIPHDQALNRFFTDWIAAATTLDTFQRKSKLTAFMLRHVQILTNRDEPFESEALKKVMEYLNTISSDIDYEANQKKILLIGNIILTHFDFLELTQCEPFLKHIQDAFFNQTSIALKKHDISVLDWTTFHSNFEDNTDFLFKFIALQKQCIDKLFDGNVKGVIINVSRMYSPVLAGNMMRLIESYFNMSCMLGEKSKSNQIYQQASDLMDWMHGKSDAWEKLDAKIYKTQMMAAATIFSGLDQELDQDNSQGVINLSSIIQSLEALYNIMQSNHLDDGEIQVADNLSNQINDVNANFKSKEYHLPEILARAGDILKVLSERSISSEEQMPLIMLFVHILSAVPKKGPSATPQTICIHQYLEKLSKLFQEKYKKDDKKRTTLPVESMHEENRREVCWTSFFEDWFDAAELLDLKKRKENLHEFHIKHTYVFDRHCEEIGSKIQEALGARLYTLLHIGSQPKWLLLVDAIMFGYFKDLEIQKKAHFIEPIIHGVKNFVNHFEHDANWPDIIPNLAFYYDCVERLVKYQFDFIHQAFTVDCDVLNKNNPRFIDEFRKNSLTYATEGIAHLIRMCVLLHYLGEHEKANVSRISIQKFMNSFELRKENWEVIFSKKSYTESLIKISCDIVMLGKMPNVLTFDQHWIKMLNVIYQAMLRQQIDSLFQNAVLNVAIDDSMGFSEFIKSIPSLLKKDVVIGYEEFKNKLLPFEQWLSHVKVQDEQSKIHANSLKQLLKEVDKVWGWWRKKQIDATTETTHKQISNSEDVSKEMDADLNRWFKAQEQIETHCDSKILSGSSAVNFLSEYFSALGINISPGILTVVEPASKPKVQPQDEEDITRFAEIKKEQEDAKEQKRLRSEIKKEAKRIAAENRRKANDERVKQSEIEKVKKRAQEEEQQMREDAARREEEQKQQRESDAQKEDVSFIPSKKRKKTTKRKALEKKREKDAEDALKLEVERQQLAENDEKRRNAEEQRRIQEEKQRIVEEAERQRIADEIEKRRILQEKRTAERKRIAQEKHVAEEKLYHAEEQQRLAEKQQRFEEERVKLQAQAAERLISANRLQVSDVEKWQQDIATPNLIKALIKYLQGQGHVTVIVGGHVRDALLNRSQPGSDIDIVTECTQAELIEISLNPNFSEIFKGLLPIAEHPELPGLYKVGKLDITLKKKGFDLTEDAMSRDMPLNAFYYDLEYIYSPLKSSLDALPENQPLTTIGDPIDSFYYDPLRMLRIIELSTKIERPISAFTMSALVDSANELNKIKYGALISHMEKMLLTKRGLINFDMIMHYDFLPYMIKGLGSNFSLYWAQNDILQSFVRMQFINLDANQMRLDRNGLLALLLLPGVFKTIDTMGLSQEQSIQSRLKLLTKTWPTTENQEMTAIWTLREQSIVKQLKYFCNQFSLYKEEIERYRTSQSYLQNQRGGFKGVRGARGPGVKGKIQVTQSRSRNSHNSSSFTEVHVPKLSTPQFEMHKQKNESEVRTVQDQSQFSPHGVPNKAPTPHN